MSEELNLMDLWRTLNPGETQFTFYSNPHKSWSRIDMAWVNGDLNKNIERIETMPNIWANPNPLKIMWKGQKRKRGRWTLNAQILKEKEHIQKISEEFKLLKIIKTRIPHYKIYGIQ
uniref:Uncharacterized protein n=1 Tax=Micrurus corallinus TaxID=54390 RepID=A0A2D4G8N2_MICCO